MDDTIVVHTTETQVVEVGIGVIGPGVPAGGADGQVLSKLGAGDYNTQWQDPPVAKASISTSSTAQATIATLATSASKAFKLLCKAQTSTKAHAAEFLVVHDGSSVYMTSYGEVSTSTSLGTWDAGFDAGLTNIRFYFTPASSTPTSVFLTYVPL